MAGPSRQLAKMAALTSSDWLIIALSGFVGLVALYTLILFVKNRYSARQASDSFNSSGGGARGAGRIVCSSCRACKSQASDRARKDQAGSWPRPACCARCGASAAPQTYGTNQLGQHPVIFGKSKDSILVPEFYANFVQQGGRPDWSSEVPVGGDTLAECAPNDDSTAPACTTRVLTDEKGHSIKIRIASPPPRRQRQLARQFRLGQSEQVGSNEQLTSPKPSHRDSLDSQSPLVGAQSEPVDRMASWIDCESSTEAEPEVVQLAEGEEKVDASETGQPAASNSADGSPIDPFNDSNTSEFDDAGSDSRQETSMDFLALVEEPSTNEQVMDPDLRQASRNNLELMLQQSQPQQLVRQASRQSSAGCPPKGRPRGPTRSRSLTANAFGSAFPQTGTLTSCLPRRSDPFAPESRRSSSATSTLKSPNFGSAPSLRLSVRPLSKSNLAENPRPGLLASTLAAIGRARSNDLAESGSGSGRNKSAADEQLFQVHLLEVRNASQPAAEPTGRRNSLEGVYARVFRHSDGATDWDAISVRSLGGQASLEFAQLPLVKLVRTSQEASEPGQQQSQVTLGAQLGQVPGYTLTCRESEFPVRISLYLATRRTGARYTLGHCFVSLDDMTSCNLAPCEPFSAESSSDSRRNSFATSTASSANTTSSLRCRFVPISGPQASGEQVRPAGSVAGEQLLEYRLFQTILEAIKQ